jgi:hypothetical protein
MGGGPEYLIEVKLVKIIVVGGVYDGTVFLMDVYTVQST